MNVRDPEPIDVTPQDAVCSFGESGQHCEHWWDGVSAGNALLLPDMDNQGDKTSVLTKTDLDEIEARAVALGFRGGELGHLLEDLGEVVEALKKTTAERDEARAWVRRLTQAERILTCAFCGEAYPPGTPESNDAALTAHVRVCAKHPMRDAEAEIARLRREVRSLRTYDRDF